MKKFWKTLGQILVGVVYLLVVIILIGIVRCVWKAIKGSD